MAQLHKLSIFILARADLHISPLKYLKTGKVFRLALYRLINSSMQASALAGYNNVFTDEYRYFCGKV